MPITLTNLVELVNAELENKVYRGSAEAEGEGDNRSFLVAPQGYTVVEDSLVAYLDDVETSNFTMDYSSGICTFTVSVTDKLISWDFDYKSWNDTMVTTAINAGINALFPHIYVAAPVTLVNNGTAEYDLDPLVEFVLRHEIQSGSGWTRKKRMFDVYRDGDHKVIQFYTVPSATVRVHTISRPSPMNSNSNTLETTAGVPTRSMFPVVSYAIYYLLTQKTAPRSRGDVAIATQGLGTLSPRQMNDAANAFYLRYQMQIQSVKMPPWSTS